MITHPAISDPRRRAFWLCVVLALSVLALYWPVTHYGFINFDDDEYVTANPHVQGGLTANAVKWAFTTGHASNWHPITWLSHMLDCQWFGASNAGAMHLVNVLFHAANAILLFLLLRRVTGADYRSLCVAALFAFHPLRVESVAWIAERKDVLSTFLGLGALWYYSSYARNSRGLSYGLSLFFLALSLMAKPMLVTLPALLLVLDYWPLRRFFKEKVNRLVVEKLPFLGLALASSLVTFVVQRQVAVVKLDQLSLPLRLANAVTTYIAYLGKTFWPTKLAFFYPHPITHPSYVVVSCAVALVLVTVAVWLWRKRSPYLVFGWLWYLGTLVPVIGLIQVGSQEMADRYTYIPSIGIFVALVWGVSDCLRRLTTNRTYAPALAGLSVVACAALTNHQIRYWKNSVTLFNHGLALTQKNLVANINIGAAYMAEGKNKEALQHYLAAVKIKADNAKAQYNLGVALASLGRTDEAMQHYRIALQIDPSYQKNLKALGDALLESGKIPEALIYFQSLLQIDPSNAAVHLVMGNTLLGTGEMAAGIKHLREVTRIEPNNFDAQVNLASALANEGQLHEARSFFQGALRLEPNSAFAHYQYGSALLDGGIEKEALQEFRQAMRLSPDSALTLDKLAWILSTSRDASLRNGKEAVKLATRACELTKNANPVTLATLAAAYAEVGQFEKALSISRQSKSLTDPVKSPALLDLINRQQTAFAADRPYRHNQ